MQIEENLEVTEECIVKCLFFTLFPSCPVPLLEENKCSVKQTVSLFPSKDFLTFRRNYSILYILFFCWVLFFTPYNSVFSQGLQVVSPFF